MNHWNLFKSLIISLLVTGLFFASCFVFAWTAPPRSTVPPNSNSLAPINVGDRPQEKSGPLTVSTLTTSGGKLYLNREGGEGGDIFRVGNIQGHDDLFLKSNESESGEVQIIGSQLQFYVGNQEKLRIESNGEITKGRIPWANLVGIPAGCSEQDTFVTAIATSSITCSPGGGAITGGQNNYLARWTGPTSLATSVIYQNGNNIGIATTVPLAGFKVDVNGSVRVRSDLRLTKPGTDRQSKLTDCTGAFNLETDSSGNIICGEDEGISSAPADAPYLVSQLHSDLMNERVLTASATSGFSFAENFGNKTFVLSTNFGTVQKRVDCPSGSCSCPGESSIRVIYENGTVECESDTTGAGLGGSGNAKKVAFFTGPNTLGSNDDFHWDGTNPNNLRLGIGTASPNSTLTVHRSSGGIAFAIRDTANANNTFTIRDSGAVSMTGFRLKSTVSNSTDYVLTTNAYGMGIWAAPPTGGLGGWKRNRTSQVVYLATYTDKVGIGVDPSHNIPDPPADLPGMRSMPSQPQPNKFTTLEIDGALRFHAAMGISDEAYFYLNPSSWRPNEITSSNDFYTDWGMGYYTSAGSLGNKACIQGTRPNPPVIEHNGFFTVCPSDYAEYFPMKDVYRGNIISITDESNPSYEKDPETPFVASKSSHPYDEKMIGIVSTLGSAIGTPYDNNYQRLALSGRLPLIISTETGTISYGDPITSSSFKGIGMKAIQKGPIVARAIDIFDPDSSTCELVNNIDEINWDKETLNLDSTSEDTPKEQIKDKSEDLDDGTNRLHWTKKCFKLSNGTMFGKITIVVQNSFYDPDVYLTDTGNLKIAENTNGNYQLTREDSSLINQIAAFKELIVSQTQAGLIETKKLSVNGIDILKKIGELEGRNERQEKQIEEREIKIKELKMEIEELTKK